MNARERVIIDRIDWIISECSTLQPRNPANTKAIFAHGPVLVASAKDVHAAFGALRGRDWVAVEDYLTDAEKRLAAHARRTDLD